MDVRDVTSSVATLFATVHTAAECLEAIRRSLGAESLVLDLLNEASDFRVLLANLEEAFDKHEALNPATQIVIQRSLLRAKKAFDDFLQLIAQKLFRDAEDADPGSKPPPTPQSSKTPTLQATRGKVSRRAWFVHEKEVIKNRNSLRQAREALNSALILVNTEIHLKLREVLWLSQKSLQTEIAAQGKTMNNIWAFVQQLGENSQRSRSPSESSERTIASVSSDDTLVAQSNRLGKENPNQKTFCFNTAVSTTRCPESCSCACHSTAMVRFPRWMTQVTGLLFMRYSGSPLMTTMSCSKRRCKERHQQSELQVSYYFPGWMLHRMIEVVTRWDVNGNPSMNLRVMRVIPDQSPLFTYTILGQLAEIQDLFSRQLASPFDVRESDGRSALHIALYNGHVELAEFLLQQKADREYKDKYFQSAIGACWEIKFGKLSIPTIEPCVIGGATEYSDYLEDRGFSPVHKIVLGTSIAPSLGDYLALTAADIDKKDVMGKTPLHYATARGDLDAVSTLIRHGANPNLNSDASWTPLIEAAISSNHDCFRPLLTAGAQVDALNARGQTALSMAVHVRDDPRYFRHLIEFNTNINLADQNGLTVLHRACVRNRIQSAQRLVHLKADINALDNKQLSPLHTCVVNNSHDVLELLLVCGAQTDHSSVNGRTLLHDAAAYGDSKTIQILADAHSRLRDLDPDVLDSQGKTVQEIFDGERSIHLSEHDEERTETRSIFRVLLDRIRERIRVEKISQALSEKLEVQSIISDDDFFEALELMESSVESLYTMEGVRTPMTV